jgi:hypothetical protein
LPDNKLGKTDMTSSAVLTAGMKCTLTAVAMLGQTITEAVAGTKAAVRADAREAGLFNKILSCSPPADLML